MDAIECIKSRMSIRGFKDKTVETDILMDIIDTARWSPSYKNTQPWEIVVLSGLKKQELSKMLVGLLNEGREPSPDIPEPESWPLEIEARIAHLLQSRAEATGMDLRAPGMLEKAKEANFNFYGAPHALYFFQDSSLTPWSIFDIGMFAQSLMLAAHAMGVGSVPQAFAIDYSAEIKKFLHIDESKRLVLGMSLGYPDHDSKANVYKTDRISTDDIVRWVE